MVDPIVISEWLDRLAIRDTLERYMRYNDDRSLDRILELFDEDAIFQVMGEIRRGRDDIGAFLAERGFESGVGRWTEDGEALKQPGSMHLSSNPVIELAGDLATAESDFVVLGRDEDGRARVLLVGRYRDRLQRHTSGRWVFTSRTGVSLARPGEAGTDGEWRRALGR